MVVSSSTSSSKGRFFLKLAAFLVLVVVLDVGAGRLLRHFYFRQISGLNQRTTYAVEECRDEILVLGSSKAKAHYSPTILRRALGGGCCNAGRDGQSLLFSAAVFHAVADRSPPRIVVLDLVPADFFSHHGHYDRLAALLPYYKTNAAVRPFVLLRSRFERLKLLSGIYPFNSLPLQIVKYNVVNEPADSGFIPLSGRIELPLDPPKDWPWIANGIDPVMIEQLRSIVARCEAEGIRLYPVMSPAFGGLLYGSAAIADIESVFEGTPYVLWDFSAHEDYVDRTDLFRDRDHLNQEGAEMFSMLLAERILAEEMEVHAGGR